MKILEKVTSLPKSLASYADRNPGTLWQVIKAYQANQRQGTVGVKTRSAVKSTGKKPYKQKKTGNARRGSFVAPLHVGGGVAHGPQARDYREATPKKMTKVALGLALAARAQSGSLYVGDLDIASGKTKDAHSLLKASNLTSERVLVCLNQPTQETVRAFRNLRHVTLVSPEQINAYHVIQAKHLVANQGSLQVIESRLSEGQGE